MNRRKAWWTAVLIGWAAMTIILGLLIGNTATNHTVGQIIEEAAAFAAIPCLVLGGMSAAVALQSADRIGLRRARLRGWTVGVGLVVVVAVVGAVAGVLPADAAVLGVTVIAMAEVELALRLQRHRTARSPA